MRGGAPKETSFKLADGLNMNEIGKLQMNPQLKRAGIRVSPRTVAAVTAAEARKSKKKSQQNPQAPNLFRNNRRPVSPGGLDTVFDWESFAKGGVPVLVDPDNYDVGGTPVGSVSAVETRTLNDGTKIEYSEAPIASPDGSVKLYRILHGTGMSSDQLVRKLQKAEQLDNLLTGPAGYQEVLSDINDAIKELNRDIADWTDMVNKYSTAIQKGDITEGQVIQLKKIIPLLQSGIEKRKVELQDLNAQKVIVDANLIQVGPVA
jgi:hypothetical protein